MANKLKPCPFCGGEATLYTHTARRYPFARLGLVKCEVCGASSRVYKCEIQEIDDDGFWEQRAFKSATLTWNMRIKEFDQCF